MSPDFRRGFTSLLTSWSLEFRVGLYDEFERPRGLSKSNVWTSRGVGCNPSVAVGFRFEATVLAPNRDESIGDFLLSRSKTFTFAAAGFLDSATPPKSEDSAGVLPASRSEDVTVLADPATAGGAPSRSRLPWFVFSSTPHLVLASSALAGVAPPSITPPPTPVAFLFGLPACVIAARAPEAGVPDEAVTEPFIVSGCIGDCILFCLPGAVSCIPPIAFLSAGGVSNGLATATTPGADAGAGAGAGAERLGSIGEGAPVPLTVPLLSAASILFAAVPSDDGGGTGCSDGGGTGGGGSCIDAGGRLDPATAVGGGGAISLGGVAAVALIRCTFNGKQRTPCFGAHEKY